MRAKSVKERLPRVPVFVTDNIDQAAMLSDWVISHKGQLKERVKEKSSHVRLTEVSPMQMGEMAAQHIYATVLYGEGNSQITSSKI